MLITITEQQKLYLSSVQTKHHKNKEELIHRQHKKSVKQKTKTFTIAQQPQLKFPDRTRRRKYQANPKAPICRHQFHG